MAHAVGFLYSLVFENNAGALFLQNDLHLLDASVRHLGTDINYIVLENIYAHLKNKVDFYFDIDGNTVGKGSKASHIVIGGEN